MGYYINPPLLSKEQWLRKHGEMLSEAITQDNAQEIWEELYTGEVTKFPVVWIDNRMFTSAGIAFSANEFKAFTEPGDNRPKDFFVVPVEKLLEVCPDLKYCCTLQSKNQRNVENKL